MINGNACFAYFNKSWGIPHVRCHVGFLGRSGHANNSQMA
jgi:hypothetical protein